MKHDFFRLSALALLSVSLQAQAKPEPLHADGIENFFKVTDTVYSGSTPETEGAFRDLQQRGIKTVVSVDGAKPDVEMAHKFGLRYVHLPIGYNGVPTNRVVELAKVGSESPGPIYIHCHHGKHRGPAGAAMICMGAEGWTAEQGSSWLRQAGTATNYAGLYQSVIEYKTPSKEEMAKVSSDLPQKVEVSPMVDAMVEIDERLEHLKLVKAAGYKQPPSHPDIDPPHEALLLHELYKELLRASGTGNHPADFLQELKQGEQATGKFYAVLSSETFDHSEAETAFKSITQNCSSCHRKFRN